MKSPRIRTMIAILLCLVVFLGQIPAAEAALSSPLTFNTYLETLQERNADELLTKWYANLLQFRYPGEVLASNALPAPTLRSLTEITGGVKLTWRAVSGAEKYRVYRKEGSGSWKRLADVTTTSYSDKTAMRGTTYTYTVRCVSADGARTMSSYDKNGLKVTSTMGQLSKPALRSVENITGGVKLTWNAVKYAEQYRVFRKEGSGNWKKLADVTTTSYSDKTAMRGTTYTYTVRCISSDSKTYLSSYDKAGLSITASSGQLPAPELVSLKKVTSGVKLTWKAVDGAGKYKVYRKDNGGSWTSLAVVDGTVTSYTDKTVKEGTYTYTVRCLSANGKTAISSYDKTGLTITLSAASGTTYRALLIGEVHFTFETANRNKGDVLLLSEMLKSVKGPNGGTYKITQRYDLTEDGIKSAIRTCFAGADSDDVSLISISTHGVTTIASGSQAGKLCTTDSSGTHEGYLTLQELASCLSNVPGKVIVLLGSCGSGAAVYREGIEENSILKSNNDGSAFIDAVIRAFSAYSGTSNLTPNTGEFRSSKFYVLTATRHMESSWGAEDRTLSSPTSSYNFFAYYLAEGASGTMPADINGDKCVSLHELFLYSDKYASGPYNGEYQHVQEYPKNSSYKLFKR